MNIQELKSMKSELKEVQYQYRNIRRRLLNLGVEYTEARDEFLKNNPFTEDCKNFYETFIWNSEDPLWNPEIRAGSEVDETANEAACLANQLQHKVVYEFNGNFCTVFPTY